MYGRDLTSRSGARKVRCRALSECRDEIEEPQLRATLAIWDCCAASAAFIFGESLGNPVAERILELLKTAGKEGMGLGEVFSRFNGHLERAICMLHLNGFRTGPGGLPAATHWRAPMPDLVCQRPDG